MAMNKKQFEETIDRAMADQLSKAFGNLVSSAIEKGGVYPITAAWVTQLKAVDQVSKSAIEAWEKLYP